MADTIDRPDPRTVPGARCRTTGWTPLVVSRRTTQPHRLRTASAPAAAEVWLDVDDGTVLEVRGRGLVGREPAATDGPTVHHLVPLNDDTLLMSRTHLEFGLDESGLWIRDCHSRNGSKIAVGESRMPLEPGMRVRAPSGSTVFVGGRRLTVRVLAGRARVGPVALDWAVHSRAGGKRGANQDSYCAESPVFMVADGMGGHSAGDAASRETAAAMTKLAARGQVTRDALMRAVTEARERIGLIPVEDGRPPGTTLSGVVVSDVGDGRPCWMVVNLGDSRTYRLDAAGLRQLTVDHSVVQSLVDRDVLTAEAARTSTIGNVLTRALRATNDDIPDVWRLPMQPGDRILVCSDGLNRGLDDAAIARLLGAGAGPRDVARDLVAAAVEGGSTDDTTALVIDAAPALPPAPAPR